MKLRHSILVAGVFHIACATSGANAQANSFGLRHDPIQEGVISRLADGTVRVQMPAPGDGGRAVSSRSGRALQIASSAAKRRQSGGGMTTGTTLTMPPQYAASP